MFAFIEYWVAAANMAFYWTVGSDMPNEEIVVVRPAFQEKIKQDGVHSDNQIERNRDGKTSSQVKKKFQPFLHNSKVMNL